MLIFGITLSFFLSSCFEENNLYEGTWEGTTSQGLPISFEVNMYGSITLHVTVSCSYPSTHDEYLGGNGIVIDNTANIFIKNWNNEEEVEVGTDLLMTFTSKDKATGSIDSELYNYSYISGSTLVTGSTTLFPKITFFVNKD